MSDRDKMALLNQYNAQRDASTTPATTPPPEKKSEPKEPKVMPLSPIEMTFRDQQMAVPFSPLAPEAAPSKSVTVLKPKVLEQFGYASFAEAPYVANPYTNIPVGPEYILGPGDNLQVRVWGKIEQQFNLVIDSNGQAYIPQVGMISLAGARYGDLPRIVKRELSKFYVNFDVSVTLSRLRSIQVFVLGEVTHPGAIELSSMGTLMMALYTAEGPTKMGSLRTIRLLRGKQVVKTVDMYAYLMAGDRSQDPILQNFDTVFVPVIGDVVKVDGLVKRPGIYEIKAGQTVYDAIEVLAGGFGMSYYGKRIQMERIVEGKKYVMMDVEMSGSVAPADRLKSEKLRNGDAISVLPIADTRYNEVSIQGNVSRPGRYEFRTGMTVGELLEKSEQLMADTDLKRAEIYRYNSTSEREIIPLDLTQPQSKKIVLKEFDILKIRSLKETEGDPVVIIDGEVQTPGTYKLLNNMKVLDAVYMAVPDVSTGWGIAELVRKTTSGAAVATLIDLRQLRENPQSSANVLLNDQDRLYIRNDQSNNRSNVVTLKGEVRYPGKYVLKRNETLADVVARAGGLTERAFPAGLVLQRASIRVLEVNSQDRIWIEEQKRALYEPARIKATGVDSKETYITSLDFIKNQAIINAGRVVLNIKTEADLLRAAIPLENDDVISIPETPSSVQVICGVNQPSAHLFMDNRNAQFYIDRSGGYSEYARQDGVLVIKGNGTAIRDANAAIERGDTIYIPEEIKTRVDWLTLLVEFSKIIANTATAFAFFSTIR